MGDLDARAERPQRVALEFQGRIGEPGDALAQLSDHPVDGRGIDRRGSNGALDAGDAVVEVGGFCLQRSQAGTSALALRLAFFDHGQQPVDLGMRGIAVAGELLPLGFVLIGAAALLGSVSHQPFDHGAVLGDDGR